MIPRQLSLQTFLLRIFATAAGSIIGGILLFGTFFIASSSFGETTTQALSLYIILAVILIGTVSTNVLTPFFISLADREQYKRPLTVLTHTFIFNLVIFIISVPCYSLLASIQPEALNVFAAFHFLLTTQISALLAEVFAEKRFLLSGIYGTAIGGIVSFSIIGFLFFMEQKTFLLFIILPILWLSIECFRSLTEYIYYWYYRLFGIEVLDTETSFEAEEGKEKE